MPNAAPRVAQVVVFFLTNLYASHPDAVKETGELHAHRTPQRAFRTSEAPEALPRPRRCLASTAVLSRLLLRFRSAVDLSLPRPASPGRQRCAAGPPPWLDGPSLATDDEPNGCDGSGSGRAGGQCVPPRAWHSRECGGGWRAAVRARRAGVQYARVAPCNPAPCNVHHAVFSSPSVRPRHVTSGGKNDSPTLTCLSSLRSGTPTPLRTASSSGPLLG